MTHKRIFAIEGTFPAEALKPLAEALTEIREDVPRVLGEIERRDAGRLRNVELLAAE